MPSIWFFPPMAFAIVMLFVIGQSLLMKSVAIKGSVTIGATKSYACGEDVSDNCFSPDYSQFFSFAFFFSIMHVVALMVATLPTLSPGSLFMPALYVVGALVGLVSLLRR